MESSKLINSKNFTNNPFFRLVAPLMLGILVYFLVLLVFDTIDQFETNFFRAELILCLIISYLVAEINRFLIVVLERKLPKEISLSKRIMIQVISSSALIAVITSAAVSLYMRNLVGFTSYSSELIVFNSLYIVLGWCLHAVYFSMVYLKRVADIEYSNEKSVRKAIEVKMESSLNELKPKFLNKCLETLIVLGFKNPDEADDYLGKVSDFYRGKLSSKNELIMLNEEINVVENFLAIHSHWIDISAKYENDFKRDCKKMKILHGAIRRIIEYIIKTAILIPGIPLNLLFDIKDDYLELNCKMNLKLNCKEYPYNEIDDLNISYSFYTEKRTKAVMNNGVFSVKIPLLIAE